VWMRLRPIPYIPQAVFSMVWIQCTQVGWMHVIEL
jgi:hypothetical protein